MGGGDISSQMEPTGRRIGHRAKRMGRFVELRARAQQMRDGAFELKARATRLHLRPQF